MNNQLENLPKNANGVNFIFTAVAITFFISFILIIIFLEGGGA